MVGVLALILAVVTFGYRKILAVSYDSEYATIRGINVSFYYTLMLVVASLGIVIAMKVVGLILVIAMLTIPVFIAERVSQSLAGMMVASAIISALFTLIGLGISYYFNLSTGATIILVATAGMLLFVVISKIRSML
jgi:zinc transport system permease protein